MTDQLLQLLWWAIRIVLALIAFLVVRWALPQLLALGGVAIPDQIVLLLAILVGLVVLAGHYYLPRRPSPPPPAA